MQFLFIKSAPKKERRINPGLGTRMGYPFVLIVEAKSYMEVYSETSECCMHKKVQINCKMRTVGTSSCKPEYACSEGIGCPWIVEMAEYFEKNL